MHELGIAQGIIDVINQEVQTRKIEQAVRKVVFKAGQLNAIIPESLLFHFDTLKETVPALHDAVLEIVVVPIKAHCPKCDRSFELESPQLVCPQCQGSLTPCEGATGREMWIDSFSV